MGKRDRRGGIVGETGGMTPVTGPRISASCYSYTESPMSVSVPRLGDRVSLCIHWTICEHWIKSMCYSLYRYDYKFWPPNVITVQLHLYCSCLVTVKLGPTNRPVYGYGRNLYPRYGYGCKNTAVIFHLKIDYSYGHGL